MSAFLLLGFKSGRASGEGGREGGREEKWQEWHFPTAGGIEERGSQCHSTRDLVWSERRFTRPLYVLIALPTNIASVNLVISYNKFFFPLF